MRQEANRGGEEGGAGHEDEQEQDGEQDREPTEPQAENGERKESGPWQVVKVIPVEGGTAMLARTAPNWR